MFWKPCYHFKYFKQRRIVTAVNGKENHAYIKLRFGMAANATTLYMWPNDVELATKGHSTSTTSKTIPQSKL